MCVRDKAELCGCAAREQQPAACAAAPTEAGAVLIRENRDKDKKALVVEER